jgi:hypothetical protein
VRVVAAREVLRETPSSIAFYPRNGIHWNELGAALAARELVATLRQAGAALPEYRFETGMRSKEQGLDLDLLRLMNLAHEPSRPPAPTVTSTIMDADSHLSLAEVSDSYMSGVNELLQRSGIFQHVDTFYYLILERRTWDPVWKCML